MPQTIFWNIPQRVLDHLRWLADRNGTTLEEEFLKMKDRKVRTRFEYLEEAERIQEAHRNKGGRI